MSWLTPLGFLGLIGLIVLIIIYIIKPNYQNKFISSTFVWKLSLKYRKKKIPINHLRNLLIFLCQVLIIAACASILAQPVVAGDNSDRYSEKVAIIDASASMRTEIDGETRFERAVDEVGLLAEEVAQNGGTLSVILAGTEASYVIQRMAPKSAIEVKEALLPLVNDKTFACTYGNADIDGAVELAEEVLLENAETEIILYTGASYINPGKIKVVDVSDVSEWNAAILDVRAVMKENYYTFEVDVASYNRDVNVPVHLNISGVNIALESYTLEAEAICVNNEVTTLEFSIESGLLGDYSGIYSFDYAQAYVAVSDNFDKDNNFCLYGGTKQPLKIQYYSTVSNNFFGGVLMAMREQFKDYWDIDIDEIQDNQEYIDMGYGKEYALEGYDIYIFEHYMPPTVPTDGLVILANPNTPPAGSDFAISNWYQSGNEMPLDKEESSPLTENMNFENVKVTLWAALSNCESYQTLASCNGSPVIIAKNEENEKVVVLGMNLNYSDFALRAEFPIFFYNILNYYFPKTINGHVYEVNDTIELNARGPVLSFSGEGGTNMNIESFPETVTVTVPGTYTLYQLPISGVDVTENFFVRIPVAESDTEAVYDTLENPYYPPVERIPDRDLVFYFALALVILLFAEWWLQSREQF